MSPSLHHAFGRITVIFKLSIFITLVPHWINMIGLMSTKICQSSRIRISPYCLYHDIMCMRTDWSERWRECQKSRSSAAQSKMLIKISESNKSASHPELIRIIPYCLYHDIMCKRADLSIFKSICADGE